jgi:hypothetical protein
MHRVRFVVTFLAVVVSISMVGTTAHSPETDLNMAMSCPLTFQPGLLENPPMGWGSYQTAYGTDRLRVTLKQGGVFVVTDALVNEAGEYGDKFLFWAPEISSSPLKVTGHRLDAEAPPLRASQSPASAGGLAVGLYFPTTGCWEVTGTRGEDSVTFVLLISRIPEWP